jgi:nicotinamidase-related amidase
LVINKNKLQMEQHKQNTALLVMDMQASILQRLPDSATIINQVSRALSTARENEIPVIYVVVGFRTGAPEMSMNNKGLSASRERFVTVNMEEFMKIEATLTPQPGEIIVTKRRVSAFTGSDLEVVLRALGIQHMILTGVATSGVVLSTLREAADKDFQITVLTDCCGDADSEVHQVLTTKIFPRQADVFTVDEWTKKEK